MTESESTSESKRNDDADLAALRDLASASLHDASPEHSDRVLRRASAAFSEAHAYAGAPWRFGAVRVWSRVFVPALLFATCVLYLTWAVRAASSLYH